MNKDNLFHKGNESLAIGAMWGIGAIVHPCSLCILTSSAFILNSIKQKILDK